MTLPLSIAQKLQQLLPGDSSMPASALKHAVVEKMLLDGVLQKRLSGKSKSIIFIRNPDALQAYLHNQFGITNLNDYVSAFNNADLTRSEAVSVSGNSKLKVVRTFKGFLVNCYEPVKASLNGQSIVVQPVTGSFTFISDYESFIPEDYITIVGIENPENFAQIHQQQYLFAGLKAVFICRYPQSNDAIKWLQAIPNDYLHFGDLDFAGINIFLNEYQKCLGAKATFFIPPNTAELLKRYGNRELYNRQLSLAPNVDEITNGKLRELIKLLHENKCVLEQEIFIGAGDA
jgi:hypothetical protein